MEFQDRSGQWRQQSYDCIYDPVNERVREVGVWES